MDLTYNEIVLHNLTYNGIVLHNYNHLLPVLKYIEHNATPLENSYSKLHFHLYETKPIIILHFGVIPYNEQQLKFEVSIRESNGFDSMSHVTFWKYPYDDEDVLKKSFWLDFLKFIS